METQTNPRSLFVVLAVAMAASCDQGVLAVQGDSGSTNSKDASFSFDFIAPPTDIYVPPPPMDQGAPKDDVCLGDQCNPTCTPDPQCVLKSDCPEDYLCNVTITGESQKRCGLVRKSGDTAPWLFHPCDFDPGVTNPQFCPSNYTCFGLGTDGKGQCLPVCDGPANSPCGPGNRGQCITGDEQSGCGVCLIPSS